MAEVRLPAGVSLRQVAETLGVSVESLKQHTELDAETVSPVDRVVQVPDGFLRSRSKSRELQDAVTRDSARKRGMNMWLAMDIEQKKTRIQTALGSKASEDDYATFEDAMRAFERIDAQSNQLAIDLAAPLSTRARDLRLRGAAAALTSLAHSARTRWFGAPEAKAKLQALSSAKAAVLADPKMSRARVAMGAALAIDATGADVDGALEEVYAGVSHQPRDGFAWAYLADMLLSRGDLAGSAPAIQQALDLDPDSSFVAEVAGRHALHNDDPKSAIKHLRRALVRSASNSNAAVQLGLALIASGKPAAGKREIRAALEATSDVDHKRALQIQVDNA